MKKIVFIAALCGAVAAMADNCNVVSSGATTKCASIVIANEGAKVAVGDAIKTTVKDKCGVLLLGDSIRMGYCGFVREAMKDRADVYWPEGNCMFAHYTLRFLYDWRRIMPDPAKIKVVHWNNGLWDIGQRDGREPLTPRDDYVKTLVRIHGELRRYFPNARIVFATTTPINTSVKCEQHTLGNAIVEEYNAAAVAALKPLGVEIDALYSFVRDNAVPYVDIVHYTPEGSRMIAGEVVRVIDGKKKAAQGAAGE